MVSVIALSSHKLVPCGSVSKTFDLVSEVLGRILVGSLLFSFDVAFGVQRDFLVLQMLVSV